MSYQRENTMKFRNKLLKHHHILLFHFAKPDVRVPWADITNKTWMNSYFRGFIAKSLFI